LFVFPFKNPFFCIILVRRCKNREKNPPPIYRYLPGAGEFSILFCVYVYVVAAIFRALMLMIEVFLAIRVEWNKKLEIYKKKV
jgi:hypothetical protein